MGISNMQKNFLLVYGTHAFIDKRQSITTLRVTHCEYLPVVYNSTFDAHHIYHLKISSSVNMLHDIDCTMFLFASKVIMLI